MVKENFISSENVSLLVKQVIGVGLLLVLIICNLRGTFWLASIVHYLPYYDWGLLKVFISYVFVDRILSLAEGELRRVRVQRTVSNLARERGCLWIVGVCLVWDFFLRFCKTGEVVVDLSSF